jgi:peptidoglycan/xylan/chitin deacetylase (PgdA/CDA1 family)
MKFLVSPPKIFRNIINEAIWEIKTEIKEIFLTFDDGPTNHITDWILDVLNEYSAKATFFCIGKNILENQKQFNRILYNQHSVGNHTFNHLNGWKTETKKYLENIIQTDCLLKSDLFRPPYGRITIKQYDEIIKSKKIIMWNVLSKDYDRSLSEEKIFYIIKKFTKVGAIIVFHDSIKAEKNMKFSLENSLKYYSNLGYKFSKII